MQEIERKKSLQNEKEAKLVEVTKKLKIKANELYKKEELLKFK